MELWREIIIAIVGMGGGAGIVTLVRWLLSRHYRRELKAGADLKEAEANHREWELEKQRIEELMEVVKTLNDLLKTQADRIAAQNAALDDKTDRIRELTDRADKAEQLANRLNAQIIRLTEELGDERLLREHYERWHCQWPDCQDPRGRKPPRPELEGLTYELPRHKKEADM